MKSLQTPKPIFSVSEINEFIKLTLENSPTLSNVTVSGEISNFTNHKSGHLYFTLKDDGAIIKCVMFKSYASSLGFIPQSGMKVCAHGRISVFPRDGQYQFYVNSMMPDGIGSLNVAYEMLKNKLDGMGLFDEDKKKPLPKIPMTIGIITSPTGAAIRDMINISKRRFPLAELILFPSLVQGEGAPSQLISGIKYFNENSVDVIIIGRGGGSIEDLWAFNDEQLAYAVFASKIPIVSAVGHETDFTICDYVADRRAPTPSAAAELVTPETDKLKQQYNNIITHLKSSLDFQIKNLREKICAFENSRQLSSPKNQLEDKRMLLIHLSELMQSKMKFICSQKETLFSSNASKLSALNPLNILSRGYGAVYDELGGVLTSVNAISENQTINVKLHDGDIKAKVISISRGKYEQKTDI